MLRIMQLLLYAVERVDLEKSHGLGLVYIVYLIFLRNMSKSRGGGDPQQTAFISHWLVNCSMKSSVELSRDILSTLLWFVIIAYYIK